MFVACVMSIEEIIRLINGIDGAVRALSHCQERIAASMTVGDNLSWVGESEE
jgi:hypothetical protein